MDLRVYEIPEKYSYDPSLTIKGCDQVKSILQDEEEWYNIPSVLRTVIHLTVDLLERAPEKTAVKNEDKASKKSVSALKQKIKSQSSDLRSMNRLQEKQKSEIDAMQMQLQQVTESMSRLQTECSDLLQFHFKSNKEQIQVISQMSIDSKDQLSELNKNISNKRRQQSDEPDESLQQLLSQNNDAILKSVDLKIDSLKSSFLKNSSTDDVIQHCEKLITENNNKLLSKEQKSQSTSTEIVQHCEQLIIENNNQLLLLINSKLSSQAGSQNYSEYDVRQVCEDLILENQKKVLSAVESKFRLFQSQHFPSGESEITSDYRSLFNDILTDNNTRLLALVESKIKTNLLSEESMRQVCEEVVAENNQNLLSTLESKINGIRNVGLSPDAIRLICEELLNENKQLMMSDINSKINYMNSPTSQDSVKKICATLIAENNEQMITTVNSTLSQSPSRDQLLFNSEEATKLICENLMAENNNQLLSAVDAKLKQVPQESQTRRLFEDDYMGTPATFEQKLEDWVKSSPPCLSEVIATKQSAYSLDVIKSFLPTALRGSSGTITSMVNEWLLSKPYSMNVLIDSWVASHPTSLRNWATNNVATTADSLRSNSEIIKEITEIFIDDKLSNIKNLVDDHLTKNAENDRQVKFIKEAAGSLLDQRFSNIGNLIDEHLSTNSTAIKVCLSANSDMIEEVAEQSFDNKIQNVIKELRPQSTTEDEIIKQIDKHLSTNPTSLKNFAVSLFDERYVSRDDITNLVDNYISTNPISLNNCFLQNSSNEFNKNDAEVLINNKITNFVNEFENHILQHSSAIKQIAGKVFEERTLPSVDFDSQIINWIGTDPECLSQLFSDKLISGKRLIQSFVVEEIDRWCSCSFQSLFSSTLRKSSDSIELIIEDWMATQPLSLSSLIIQNIQKYSSETLPNVIQDQCRSSLQKDGVRMIENWVQTSPESLRLKIKSEIVLLSETTLTTNDVHNIIDSWMMSSPTSLKHQIIQLTKKSNSEAPLTREAVEELINSWVLSSPDSLNLQIRLASNNLRTDSEERIKKIINEWVLTSPQSLRSQISEVSKKEVQTGGVESIDLEPSQSEVIFQLIKSWMTSQPAVLKDVIQTELQDMLGSKSFHSAVVDIVANRQSAERESNISDICSSDVFISAVTSTAEKLVLIEEKKVIKIFENWISNSPNELRKAVVDISTEERGSAREHLLRELKSLADELMSPPEVGRSDDEDDVLQNILLFLSNKSAMIIKSELREELIKTSEQTSLETNSVLADCTLSEVLFKIMSATSCDAATSVRSQFSQQLSQVVDDAKSSSPLRANDNFSLMFFNAVTTISKQSLAPVREELLSQLNELADTMSQSIREMRDRIVTKDIPTSRTDTLLQKLKERTEDFIQSDTPKDWLNANQTYLTTLLLPTIKIAVNEKFKTENPPQIKELYQSLSVSRTELENLTRVVKDLQQQGTTVLPDLVPLHRSEQSTGRELEEIKKYSDRLQELESQISATQNSINSSPAVHRQQVEQLITSANVLATRVAALENQQPNATTISRQLINSEFTDLTTRVTLLESQRDCSVQAVGSDFSSQRVALEVSDLTTRLTSLESQQRQSAGVTATADAFSRQQMRRLLTSELSDLTMRVTLLESQERDPKTPPVQITESEKENSSKIFIEENAQLISEMVSSGVTYEIEDQLPAVVRSIFSSESVFFKTLIPEVISQLERSDAIPSLIELELHNKTSDTFNMREAIHQHASTLSQVVVPEVISFLKTSNLLQAVVASEGNNITTTVMDVVSQNVSKISQFAVPEILRLLESSQQLQQLVTTHLNVINRDETNSSLALSNSKDFKSEVSQKIADFAAMKVEPLSQRVASLEGIPRGGSDIPIHITEYINQQFTSNKELSRDVVLSVLKSNASFFAGALLPGVLSDVRSWLEVNAGGSQNSPALSLSKVQDIVTSLLDDKLTDTLQKGLNEEHIKELLHSKMDSNIVVTELVRLENSKTNRLETNELLSQKANIVELQNLADELNEIKNGITSHQRKRRLSKSP